MTTKLSMIRESLTQTRNLLSSVITSSTELPVELLEKLGLQKIMADAHNIVVKAMFAVSSPDLGAIEIRLAREAVRKLLAILQDSASQQVIESVLVRRVATALTLLCELDKAQNEENKPISSSNASASPKANLDRSMAVLIVDMYEDSAHSFFTDLAGTLDSGGLFVASYDLKPVGQTVALRVRLDPETTLNLHGTIVWTREYNHAVPDMRPGMGISLHTVAEREHRAIQRHIVQRDVLYFEAC